MESVEETPELSDPLLICGLPGSALVGKLAVDHLIQELPGEHFGEVYLDGMSPQVFVEADGTVSSLNNDLFFWKSKVKGAPDLILYTADAQPATQEAEYILCDTVIDYTMKKFKATHMITLGAFVTGGFTSEPKVYAAATEENLVQKASAIGCEIMTDGSITGMNGILLGIAKLKGMKGYALLGETSGYALDPKASVSLLTKLEKLVNIKVDLSELNERAKEAASVLSGVENMRRQQAIAAEGELEPETGPASEDQKKLDYIS